MSSPGKQPVGIAARRQTKHPVAGLRQAQSCWFNKVPTYPNCWNLVFGQKDGARRIRENGEQRAGHRESGAEGVVGRMRRSGERERESEVLWSGLIAHLGQTSTTTTSLQRKAERWLAALFTPQPMPLHPPYTFNPFSPRPCTRNPMALEAGGDWTHLGDCGTRHPTTLPLSSRNYHPLSHPPFVPRVSRLEPFPYLYPNSPIFLSLSLSLFRSLFSPFSPYPSCTAVNRVYPLAVAQPFNQTDWNIPWIQKKRTTTSYPRLSLRSVSLFFPTLILSHFLSGSTFSFAFTPHSLGRSLVLPLFRVSLSFSLLHQLSLPPSIHGCAIRPSLSHRPSRFFLGWLPLLATPTASLMSMLLSRHSAPECYFSQFG